MFKYETHCHTSMGSRCAVMSVDDVLKLYKKHKFTGIFITEHFLNGNTTIDKTLPWKEQIERYCKAYEEAKCLGEKYGLDVFFGWEYSYWYKGKCGKSCGGNDFLTYGLDKAWLLAHPEIINLELPEYCDFIHENGGFIIHAHPFRESDYIDMIRLVPKFVDGVEVLNSSRPDGENRIAEIFADFYGLPKTSGSDFHSMERQWISGIETEEKITSPYDMLKLIKENKVKIFKEEL